MSKDKLLHIDVWIGEGKCVAECINSVNKGKLIMREQYKKGATDIRMYVRNQNGDSKHNAIYYFKDSKIIKENDNYNN